MEKGSQELKIRANQFEHSKRNGISALKIVSLYQEKVKSETMGRV
jgi:hypothetical protein